MAVLMSSLSPELKSDLRRELNALDTKHATATSGYYTTLHDGLKHLSSSFSDLGNPAWEDAVAYCRAVIENPQDTPYRALSEWTRSSSKVFKELSTRFGPDIINAARQGTEILKTHFHGNLLNIAHVNKKANTQEHIHALELGSVFQQPHTSVLAASCYELTIFCCAVVQSAWLSPEKAVKSSLITNASICDDYHAFTRQDRAARLKMVALALGAAHQLGGPAINMLVDGTTLQAEETGIGTTMESALAWRAVGGGATGYSAHLWATGSLEEGLVAPEVMMATHDLLDWRSDAAAGNHENGVSAMLGLGCEDAFDNYLEGMLRRARFHPTSGAYAIGGTIFLHFISSRYGAYRYLQDEDITWSRRDRCLQLLQDIIKEADFQVEPRLPPRNFDEGKIYRKLAKTCIDYSACADFRQHAQLGLSWFLALLKTGQVRVFDVFYQGNRTIDAAVGWV
jgi:hypothetical protein